MSEKISIVFPCGGAFDTRRLFLAVESVRAQDYPSVEIVVSEHNKTPTYKKTAEKQGVKYVFRKKEYERGKFNSSAVRNDGIKASTGKYVYLNDGDIVFLGKRFLSNVVRFYQKHQPYYAYYPLMKHLLLEHFEDFYKKAKEGGLESALENLEFPDGYTTAKKGEMKMIRFGYGKRRAFVPSKLYKSMSKDDFERYGYSKVLLSYHPGAIFIERTKLIKVGGYCEEYAGWGGEDVDLQLKLLGVAKEQGKWRKAIPKKSSYAVLHLDHEERALKQERQDVNDAFLSKRHFEKTEFKNLKEMIRHDRKVNGF